MARLAMPADHDLTQQQKRACDAVIAGKRGKVPAPMVAWLRNPELANRTQALGELLRYETTLPPELLELAIIVCARHWSAHVQWRAHAAYARDAGIEPAVIAAIADRRTPEFVDQRQRLVYDVAIALLASARVPLALYERAVAQLGERGLVELVVLLGYYCIASFTLNAFELGLPESAARELGDPDYPAT
ncbi:carboxymuconolactone decarboxylase family protein [Sphingomonas sp. CL5.1]|uniref:carboxymuconolactone decarboxylase family protein n=1 Tax=Sphingomonas sp. CL5.1 TaxID=2653203 RepID=UPI00158173F5|nr:carboxymuconolactone decarboxylase family protein [Sphingomonas sp. CL5.1]QKS00620.1 carboxymuconolactone decarboxylase family protein [Sphingomonas sp. CL5.1]